MNITNKKTPIKSIGVADIFRQHLQDFDKKYFMTPEQRKVSFAIINCRTHKMGHIIQKCHICKHEQELPLSCGNRHCPTCQELAKAKWLIKKEAEVLPVPYAHCVFTIPGKLYNIAYANKRAIYKLIFDTSWEVIKGMCNNPKEFHYGKPGYMAILHTWTQLLLYHPHVHLAIPIGVLRDGKWISNKKYFLNGDMIANRFKQKFLYNLKQLYKNNNLHLTGKLKYLNKKKEFNKFLKPLYVKKWILDIGKASGGAKGVLDYLARYTHRVAISNNRILKLENGDVTFSYQNREKGIKEFITISAVEFIRRYLLHVLPTRFTKIRYYGYLSNCIKAKNITLIKNQILQLEKSSEITQKYPVVEKEIDGNIYDKIKYEERLICPDCKKGKLIPVFIVKFGRIIRRLIDLSVLDAL